jgi:phage recombination protein Bet
MSTQTTELAKRGPRGVVARQNEFLPEEDIELVRKLCGDLNEDEFKQFVYVCRARRLNPLLRQIYAVRRKGKVVHQTSIDGFRAIAARTNTYAGSDEPTFEGEPGKKGFVAHVTVWKLVGGIRCPFSAAASWEEYCPEDPKDAWMWRKMPRNQLAKCTEALSLRKGWPEDLGGLYTDDEMAQAGNPIEIPVVRAGTLKDLPTLPPGKLQNVSGTDLMDDITSNQLRAATAEPVRPAKKHKAPAPRPVTDPNSVPLDKDGPKISREQQHLLFAIAKEQGIDHERLKSMVQAFLGVESTKDIPKANFDALIRFVEYRPEAEGQEEVIS